MFTITKEFHFSASHQLFDLPEGHQCARLHGHNYIVQLVLQSTTVNDIGFVRDYGDMKEFGDYIDNTYDHRHLNNIVDCNPTAENMCELLFNKFAGVYPELVAVRISETPRTWAEFRAN